MLVFQGLHPPIFGKKTSQISCQSIFFPRQKKSAPKNPPSSFPYRLQTSRPSNHTLYLKSQFPKVTLIFQGGYFKWYPQIIQFSRVFHYFHHPYWEFYLLFLETPEKILPPSRDRKTLAKGSWRWLLLQMALPRRGPGRGPTDDRCHGGPPTKMDVSENSGVFPPNHPLKNRVFHYKSSILGAHPYFWKHPNDLTKHNGSEIPRPFAPFGWLELKPR